MGNSKVVEWRSAVWIVLLSCAAVVGIFWHTISAMVDVWTHSRTFAHGLLVLPACFYLIWCYRGRLSGIRPAPSGWGLSALMVAGSGWFIAYQMDAPVGQQLAVIAMFPGLVWTILGTQVFHALLVPLGFLIFALPVGTAMEPWLQDVTATFIVAGLRLIGIPVNAEGYAIAIPSGTWEVARDCGGLRYVLPGLALGYLYAAVTYRHWAQRLGFLLLCISLLIIVNGFRAYAIIVSNHLGIADGTDHRVFSYTIYGVTILMLFWLGSQWEERGPRERPVEKAWGSDNVSALPRIVLSALVSTSLLALISLGPLFFPTPERISDLSASKLIEPHTVQHSR
jgi:exosortase A